MARPIFRSHILYLCILVVYYIRAIDVFNFVCLCFTVAISCWSVIFPGYIYLGSKMTFYYHLSFAYLIVISLFKRNINCCSLVFTCWERADFFALLCVMFYCYFATFPCGVLGQVWCLIVSISYLCHLSYFSYSHQLEESVANFGVAVFNHLCKI